MLRLLALPFALILGVISVGLITAGVALLEEEASDGGRDRNGALLDLDAFSDDDEARDDSGAIAGASLLGFGVLGAIGAVALLIASLSGGRPAPEAVAPGQQQQQQVVVVTHPDGRVEVQERR